MTESDLESAIIRLEAAAFRHGADGAFEDATTWLLERTLETLPLRGIGFRTPDLGPSPECLTRGVLSSAQAAELIRTVLPLTVELRADLEHATARVTPAEPLEIEIEGASGLGDDLSAALRAESVTRFWVIPLVLAGPRTASASERGTLLVLHSAPSGSLDSVVRRLQEMWQIFLGSRLRDQDHRTLIAEMDAVLAAPPDAIIVIDAAGTIELVNPATERVFGWKAHELRGNNVRMLMPEPFRVHHDGYLRNYLSTGRARIIGLGREVEALRRDGSIFPVDLSVGEIAPVTGRPRFIGLIRDISERKRTERELAETRDRLTHVSRVSTLGEMASGIAHEVNQPLTAISTYASACRRLLETERATRADVLQFLNDIAEEGLRAGNIIHRLRQLTRRGAGQVRRCHINEVVQDVMNLVELDTRHRGVRIALALAPALPAVKVDPVQIQQVLLNLIRNATDAMEAVDPERRLLLIATRLEGDRIVVSVTDRGVGIPKDKPNVFDPFVSDKPAGMGLGLSISRSILEAHDGRLWHEPNPAGGTIFSFSLAAGGEEIAVGNGFHDSGFIP